MRKIKIQDIKGLSINGIQYETALDRGTKNCGHFDWHPTKLTANFKSNEIKGGIVNFWNSEFSFKKVETHTDAEIFHVTEGNAIMIFADVEDDTVVEESVQIVRVPQNTRLIIEAGKGHFAPILSAPGRGTMVVACPEMTAFFHDFEEEVVGYF